MTTSGQDWEPPLTREDVSAVDAMGRPRQVSVYSRGDRVVLVAPPGEVAVLHPDEARALADRLYVQADASPQPSATVLPFPVAKARSSRPRTGSGT